jgi:hypothetical protein
LTESTALAGRDGSPYWGLRFALGLQKALPARIFLARLVGRASIRFETCRVLWRAQNRKRWAAVAKQPARTDSDRQFSGVDVPRQRSRA